VVVVNDPDDGFDAGADEASRRRWGYGVWGLVGVVIAVPELWAVSGTAPWPTISATVGYLEGRWNWVALIVVALIVVPTVEIAERLTLYIPGRSLTPAAVSRRLGRTEGGRSSRAPEEVRALSRKAWLGYFVNSLLGLVVAILFARSSVRSGGSRWVTACMLYSLIAVLFMVLPNVFVVVWKKEVPFPTLVQTLASLNRSRQTRPLFLLAIALIVILLLHLAFYPWPRIPNAGERGVGAAPAAPFESQALVKRVWRARSQGSARRAARATGPERRRASRGQVADALVPGDAAHGGLPLGCVRREHRYSGGHHGPLDHLLGHRTVRPPAA
jgi:hypothetical protein